MFNDQQYEELLERPTIQIDRDDVLPYIQNKVILVTGAAGSIGSVIVKQLCNLSPKEIVLFDHNENGLFFLEKELHEQFINIKFTTALGSIRDYQRLKEVFEEAKPQIVYHAAANKHVPLSEAHAFEAFKTNVIGTSNVVDLSKKYVENFIFISTDKAVDPTSIMGATKKVAEAIVNYASLDEDYLAQWAAKTDNYNIVRFGNVLGSAGSILPIFKKEMEEKKTITITHPDMERYFMTIPEAARLVIQASAFKDNGKLYVLNMGKQIKVLDLARRLISILGYSESEIEIKFSAPRPGEKLSEKLLTKEEALRLASTKHPYITQVHMSTNYKDIRIIRDLFRSVNDKEVRDNLLLTKFMI